jgi:hypothetical protein
MTTPTGPTMPDLGPVVSRHGRSRTAVVPLVAGIVVLLCSTAIPLALWNGAHVDPVHLPTLYGATAALVALGLLMVLGWKLMGLKTHLTLHAHGVSIHDRRDGRTEHVPFADMMDVYRFRTGGYAGGIVNALAFRRSPSDPWVDILENRRNAFALQSAVLEGYTAARLPIALQAIQAGDTVRFHAMTTTSRRVKRVTGGMLKVDVHAVDLNATGIKVAGRHIALSAVEQIDASDGAGTVRLVDGQGGVVYAFDYLALFSADLFLALIAAIVEQREPAYRNLMAH